MSRYIDIDEYIKEQCNSCDGYCENCNCDCLNCKSENRCEFIKELSKFPTAEVKHIVIEELEKIKTEIKNQYSFYTDYGVQLACESSCNIIDKHISELRKEQPNE